MIKIFTSKMQKIGELGESAATTFLIGQGYSIIDRNVSNPYGEIDIVAKRNGVVFFFEVKAGKEGSPFDPIENLTSRKIRIFLQAVHYYRAKYGIITYRVQGLLVLQSQDGKYTVEAIDLA